METASLEVNYLGFAVKTPEGMAPAAGDAAAGEAEAPKLAPGALAKGLRNFQRSYHRPARGVSGGERS